MIHFIRDKESDTIVDCSATEDDIHCSVNIYNFWHFMEEYRERPTPAWPLDYLDIAARDFDAVQEIRGLYWERNVDKETPDAMAARVLKEIAERYDLFYVTD